MNEGGGSGRVGSGRCESDRNRVLTYKVLCICVKQAIKDASPSLGFVAVCVHRIRGQR